VTDRVALLTPDPLKKARKLLGLQRASRPWTLDALEAPLIHWLAGWRAVCAYTVFPIQMSFDVVVSWTMVPLQRTPRTIVRSTERLPAVPPERVKLCAAIVFALASAMIVVTLSGASGSVLPEEPHPVAQQSARPRGRPAPPDGTSPRLSSFPGQRSRIGSQRKRQ
jgi:hypothetical protein